MGSPGGAPTPAVETIVHPCDPPGGGQAGVELDDDGQPDADDAVPGDQPGGGQAGVELGVAIVVLPVAERWAAVDAALAALET